MTLSEALAIFGRLTVPTAEELAGLYRTLAKKAHPDTGGSEAEMLVLQAARELLEAAEPGTAAADGRARCAFCRGTGSLRHGFASRPCSTCGGTGYVTKAAVSETSAEAGGYDPIADMVGDMPARLSMDFKRRLARGLFNAGWRKPQ